MKSDFSTVLMWASGRDEAERLTRILAEGGAVVRCFAGDDDQSLVDACRKAPSSFVILDASATRAEEMCSRLRALERGEHTTIAVADVAPPEQAAILEAGADVAWPTGVSAALVVGAVRRATVRARDVETVTSVIDSATDALFIVSTDGIIRSANIGVQAMLGHAPPTLEGRALWELVDAEDDRLVRALVDEAARGPDLAPPCVVRMRRHDDTSVEIDLTARSMLDDPAIRGVLVSAREASERMSVGTALQEAEIRFGAIFENFLDGLVQIDERSRLLVRANPAFSRMTGYGPDGISHLTLLDLVPPTDRRKGAEILDEHFRGTRSVSEAMCILHENGTPLYVDLGTTRMELSGVPFVLAVVRDVTARRETERTRELFLAVVAHELRTPVAVLQNSVELLRSRPPPSPNDHEVIVDVITEEVGRLAGLVADAVDLGAIQAGTFVVKPSRVDLAPLVASVVARVSPQFDGRAELRMEAVDVHVDPLRFEQIVGKLVDNAWRHGGSPEIQVSLAAVDGVARLEVTDCGPGLPRELQSTIFERVLLPNERPTAGIGIGLWLAKRLVSSMGGSIEAAPGPGGAGLTVTVTFPLADHLDQRSVISHGRAPPAQT
jgi:PAS domain S-box-containing protein